MFYLIMTKVQNGEIDQVLKSLHFGYEIIVESKRRKVNQSMKSFYSRNRVIIEPKSYYIMIFRDRLRNDFCETFVL